MNLQEYLTPANYEAEEWSRPDELALFHGLWSTAQACLDDLPGASVLDVCCGSGMSLLGIASHPNIAAAVGVDIDVKNISFAAARFREFPRVRFVTADALSWLRQSNRFDLIVMSSAYHHIPPGSQRRFAGLVANSLSERGVIVAAENIVPEYDRPMSNSYLDSVNRYYTAVHECAIGARPRMPSTIQELIRENLRLAARGEVEFKVCMNTFVVPMKDAGLRLVSQTRVWPSGADELPESSGNFIFLFKRDASGPEHT